MDLKVYDSNNNWVRVRNAASVEYAKQYAVNYMAMVGPLRVVEMQEIEVPITD